MKTMNRRPGMVMAGLATGLLLAAGGAGAQGAKVKVGFMLPYTGTYAALGNAIENGFRLYVQEQGGKLGGREIEFFKVDDESDPSKGVENASKLVQRDKVDVIVDVPTSSVALAVNAIAKDKNKVLLVSGGAASPLYRP